MADMREKLGREVRVFETSSISQRPSQVSSAGNFFGSLILILHLIWIWTSLVIDCLWKFHRRWIWWFLRVHTCRFLPPFGY